MNDRRTAKPTNTSQKSVDHLQPRIPAETDGSTRSRGSTFSTAVTIFAIRRSRGSPCRRDTTSSREESSPRWELRVVGRSPLSRSMLFFGFEIRWSHRTDLLVACLIYKVPLLERIRAYSLKSRTLRGHVTAVKMPDKRVTEIWLEPSPVCNDLVDRSYMRTNGLMRTTCGKQTTGSLQQRHTRIDQIKPIGKESNSCSPLVQLFQGKSCYKLLSIDSPSFPV
jgi:hypothetical protein